jgi:hypothetical protein
MARIFAILASCSAFSSAAYKNQAIDQTIDPVIDQAINQKRFIFSPHARPSPIKQSIKPSIKQ